jgi:hypothetical protein
MMKLMARGGGGLKKKKRALMELQRMPNMFNQ